MPVCDTRDKLTGMETTAKKPLIGGRKKDPRVSDLDRKYHRKARESAEIEARKKLQEPPSPTITVNLAMRHNLNGQIYGPGVQRFEAALFTHALVYERDNLPAQQGFCPTHLKSVIITG